MKRIGAISSGMDLPLPKDVKSDDAVCVVSCTNFLARPAWKKLLSKLSEGAVDSVLVHVTDQDDERVILHACANGLHKYKEKVHFYYSGKTDTKRLKLLRDMLRTEGFNPRQLAPISTLKRISEGTSRLEVSHW